MILQAWRLQVLLKLSREKLLRRLEARQALGAHFMPATLLDSQLATLEEGGKGMVIVSGGLEPEVSGDLLYLQLQLGSLWKHNEMLCAGENTTEGIVATILDRTVEYPTA